MADKTTGELTSPEWAATLETVARQIHAGKLKGPISQDMVKQMAAELMKGVSFGFAQDDKGGGLGAVDPAMVKAIQNNVFIFSGFKNYQQLREVSDLLIDKDGHTRDFKPFFEDVQKIDDTYNKTYASAEFNTATTTATSISREQTFQREKAALPYVEWVATGGDTECEVCGALDGTKLPVDHPFWADHGIPVHFKCECLKVQSADEENVTAQDDIPQPDYPDNWKMFKTNAADTGVIFPEKHPYFEVSMQKKREIEKAVKPLIPKK